MTKRLREIMEENNLLTDEVTDILNEIDKKNEEGDKYFYGLSAEDIEGVIEDEFKFDFKELLFTPEDVNKALFERLSSVYCDDEWTYRLRLTIESILEQWLDTKIQSFDASLLKAVDDAKKAGSKSIRAIVNQFAPRELRFLEGDTTGWFVMDVAVDKDAEKFEDKFKTILSIRIKGKKTQNFDATVRKEVAQFATQLLSAVDLEDLEDLEVLEVLDSSSFEEVSYDSEYGECTISKKGNKFTLTDDVGTSELKLLAVGEEPNTSYEVWCTSNKIMYFFDLA